MTKSIYNATWLLSPDSACITPAALTWLRKSYITVIFQCVKKFNSFDKFFVLDGQQRHCGTAAGGQWELKKRNKLANNK